MSAATYGRNGALIATRHLAALGARRLLAADAAAFALAPSVARPSIVPHALGSRPQADTLGVHASCIRETSWIKSTNGLSVPGPRHEPLQKPPPRNVRGIVGLHVLAPMPLAPKAMPVWDDLPRAAVVLAPARRVTSWPRRGRRGRGARGYARKFLNACSARAAIGAAAGIVRRSRLPRLPPHPFPDGVKALLGRRGAVTRQWSTEPSTQVCWLTLRIAVPHRGGGSSRNGAHGNARRGGSVTARRVPSQGLFRAAAWGQAFLTFALVRDCCSAVRFVEPTAVPERIVVLVKCFCGVSHPVDMHVMAIVTQEVLGGILSVAIVVSRWCIAVRCASATALRYGGP